MWLLGDFMLFNVLFYVTVPHSNLYAVVNPVYLKVDFLTILWLNAFLLNLLKNAVS